MTATCLLKVRCLDCSWTVDESKRNRRGMAKMHASRKGHRVELETVTTLVYSDTPIRKPKGYRLLAEAEANKIPIDK